MYKSKNSGIRIMNIRHILLSFTLVSLVATGPIMAAVESNNVEQAKSTFQTFKKDIKCAFSREGCTREQKIRMAKRGLKLLGAIALLYGALKVKAKVTAFRAKVMARDAKLEAFLAEIKRRQRGGEREAREANEREREREPERKKERQALKSDIERRQREQKQQEQQRAREEALIILGKNWIKQRSILLA